MPTIITKQTVKTQIRITSILREISFRLQYWHFRGN